MQIHRRGSDRYPRCLVFGRKQECPIYSREALPLGTKIKGAAILEQLDTTIIVNPGDLVEVDDFGNLIMSVGED